MKYLFQLAIIGAVTFVSELISNIVPLPVPASVYGIVLLFFLLYFKILKLEWVENAADFLLAAMPLMFVPAAVGIMNDWKDIKDDIVGFVICAIISTLIVMIISGLVTQAAIKRKIKRRGKELK